MNKKWVFSGLKRKEKYKQLCLYTRFGGIRTIVYTQTAYSRRPLAVIIKGINYEKCSIIT